MNGFPLQNPERKKNGTFRPGSAPIAALVLCLTVFVTTAKDILIPENSWQRLPEGIMLSLTLRGHSVAVHIRNTSTTTRQLANQGHNLLFKLFYMDDYGTPVPLGGGPPAVPTPLPDLVSIAPGKEIPEQTILSSEELALLKSHPVTCMLTVHDPVTGQDATVQSTPNILQ